MHVGRFVASLVALATVVAACGTDTVPGGAPGSPAATSEAVRIKVGLSPVITMAPLYIAEQEGHFRRHGIEVEFVESLDTPALMVPFIEGDLDVFAGTLATSLFTAMAAGAPVRIVADKGYVDPDGCPYFAVLARGGLLDEPGAGSAEWLRGKRISNSGRQLSTLYLYSEVLRQRGLTLDDLEAIDVPLQASAEALRSGQLDLSGLPEPFVTQSIDAGAEVWVAAGDVIPGFQVGILAFNGRLLDEDRDAGSRFLAGYLEGVRQYGEGKTDRNLDIVSDSLGLPRDLLEQMCWPPFRADGTIDTDGVVAVQEVAVAAGQLEQVVTADRFYDPALVERAAQLVNEGP